MSGSTRLEFDSRRGTGSSAALGIIGLVSALVLYGILVDSALSEDRPFRPIRERSNDIYRTDRTVVDIEIVGSTSRNRDFHQLEPWRVLRFRLERAYIGTLLIDEP